MCIYYIIDTKPVKCEVTVPRSDVEVSIVVTIITSNHLRKIIKKHTNIYS